MLAYARVGAGRRPVVLLHGLLGSGRNLATLGRELAARNADLGIVLFDLTGHGVSPALPPGAGTAALATDVLASARALGLQPPLALVGHSLGGRVALRAAMLEPASIASVTLLDIAPGPLGPGRGGDDVAGVIEIFLTMPDALPTRAAARAALLQGGLAPAIADWLLLNLEPSGPELRWRVDRRALAELNTRVAAEDLWPAVEASSRRWIARCVRGGDSGFVGERDASRLEVAGCAVITIHEAGHFLHVERPQPVADAVAAVLATTA